MIEKVRFHTKDAIKSLILHVFWREKWSKKHAFILWSSVKVIKKVRFHTKDADLNSSITKKKAYYFCHQNRKLKSLILHVFWHEKLRKKHAFRLWSTKKVIGFELFKYLKKLSFLSSKSQAKILNFACFLTWKIAQKTRV